MKLLDISSRKHPNTFTMVDDADYEWLNKWRWYKGNRGYVVRTEWEDGKKHTILMHREILQPPAGMKGDHRFGDRLDNRRESLRICTNAENSRNRKPNKGRSLPKGVRWHNRRFVAGIQVNNKYIHLGCFLTESQAKLAYDNAAMKYHGEFARPTPKER